MIFTVTMNPARDRSLIIENFAAGSVNRIKSFHDDAGGKGINVSKAIKELGGKTTALGVIGGSTGSFIRDSLDSMGIRSSFTVRYAETRTNLKIQDPINHTTTDINESGAPLAKETAQQVLDNLLTLVHSGDSVIIAGKTDTNAVDICEWISALKSRNVKVFLDTEGAALSEGIKAGPYAVKPNIDELGILAGHALSRDEAATTASDLIRSYGIGNCLISLGKDGAMLVTSRGILSAAAPETEVVCTTGAGDTMLGAFAYAIDCGMHGAEALRLSVAAGSAAVSCPGTQCPSKDQIYKLIEKVTVQDYEIP